MIPTALTITGAGTFGELQPGWSVNEEITPLAIGDSSGAVDSASVTVAQGEDSEFLINEQVQIVHDELGSFYGHASTASSNGASEATDTNMPLAVAGVGNSLTAERTARVAAGPYNILEAGILRQGGAGTFHPDGHNPRHMVAGTDGNLYRIDNSPTSSDVIIIQITPAGVRTEVTLTVSGTPLNNPGDIYGFAVAPTAFVVFYVLGGVRRLGFFNRTTGVQTAAIGANGTGNGQFGFVGYDVVFWSANTNNVYVVDAGNNRVQRFSMAAAYVGQWALANAYNIAGSNSNVYVFTTADMSVREYSPAGVATGRRIDTGLLTTFTVSFDGTAIITTNSATNTVKMFDIATNTLLSSIQLGLGSVAPTYISSNSNFVYVYTTTSATPYFGYQVRMLAVGTTTLYTAFAYYAALGGVSSISYEASSNPGILMPGWTDAPWNKIKELAAARNVEVAVVDGVLTVRDIGSRTLGIENVQGGSVSLGISSQQTARQVSITYTNPSSSSTGIFYDASRDGNTISFRTGQIVKISLTTQNQLASVSPAIFDTTFSVTDTDNVRMAAADWGQSGASISYSLDPERPYSVDLTIVAPKYTISGTNGNYQLSVGDVPAFSITGRGLFMNPVTIVLETGADPIITSQLRASDIKNLFIESAAMAYDRGIWRSEQLAGPQLQLSATLPTSALDGFGLTGGSLISFKESIYRVDAVRISYGWANLTASRRVTQADAQLVHGGKTMGQVDTFWAGTKYKDQIIKPLRPIV